MNTVNLDGSVTVRRGDDKPPAKARSVRAIGLAAFEAVNLADGDSATAVTAAPADLFLYRVRVVVARAWLGPWRRRRLERAATAAALLRAPWLSLVVVEVVEAWRENLRLRRARGRK